METAMLDEIRIGDRIETGRASEFRGEIGSLGFCLQKVVYAVVHVIIHVIVGPNRRMSKGSL
jgi:hypothetical protein